MDHKKGTFCFSQLKQLRSSSENSSFSMFWARRTFNCHFSIIDWSSLWKCQFHSKNISCLYWCKKLKGKIGDTGVCPLSSINWTDTRTFRNVLDIGIFASQFFGDRALEIHELFGYGAREEYIFCLWERHTFKWLLYCNTNMKHVDLWKVIGWHSIILITLCFFFPYTNFVFISNRMLKTPF